MADIQKAKASRRTAKVSLTRAGKALRSMVESKRPASEVRESFVKMQEAYEKLIVKHEDVTQLIETDEEFAKEEEWLEESLEMFIRLEIYAKEYIDQSVATGKKSIVNVLHMREMASHQTTMVCPECSRVNKRALTPPRTMIRLLKTAEMITPFRAERVVSKWKSQRCRSSVEM